MPLLQLNLTQTRLDSQQCEALSSGLTQLMSEILRKRKDLTVLSIHESTPVNWTVGARTLSMNQWCASLIVYITDGTNTDEEISEFISSADSLIKEVMTTPASAPVYIVINQIDSNCWGYDGQTQRARKLGSA
ncbi:tautomerase family protein [Limnobacter alexandrii]|jgi:4-oxalocrotonate tautomerase|uniref:tautomerase family protein n=1 Tax=Limnobacter alexandrii TaxID=2570352 RepID=UPI00110964D7|nr:tautomerase family protein [Limnobacter alexandrii]